MPEKTNDTLPFDADIERTADVVSAYVTNNSVQPVDLPNLIASVHAALTSLGHGKVAEEKPVPAIDPKRSVKPDSIVCLDCGKQFKSLKRHLNTSHDMTPNQYRAKWDLAPDYPLVAPNYAEQRSALAKSLGLGRKPKQATKKRGRK